MFTKFIAEIPIMLIVPLILNAINFWAIGFVDRYETFLEYYLIFILATCASCSIGYMLSACFNSESMAAPFIPLI